MAELVPYPFGKLVTRMLRELEARDSVFDLPRRRFLLDNGERDYSVSFHGKRAATPFGPAAGPHSQMAQNLALSWLGGARILELKTVQVLDELEIPRPCIDMQNVGYNVEWSQELKLSQSLDEYVKGMMLIRILAEALEVPEALRATIYDMSVGYDLKGIRTEGVQAFIKGMRDARSKIDLFRKEIPEPFKRYRDLDFQGEISNTLTLSTFHGCPPDEIEKIIAFLLDGGLHCVVKLNPTLLGPDEVRRLMRESMGYDDAIHTPDSAFEKDTRWDQAVEFAGRLKAKADGQGLGFGVKFNNTLIVENHRTFFPKKEKEMYLSGPPLHVLGMNLVRKWRRTFSDGIPISFSAGIDRLNFPEAVALGLVPITVCSDLLKPGGYQRAFGYFEELAKRMDAAGAKTIEEFILKRAGRAELSDAKLRNTEVYVADLEKDGRYSQEKNRTVPKKIGSKLELFNCITCDKCVPVCPNDANFTYDLPKLETKVVKLRKRGTAWEKMEGQTLVFDKKHQLANFADFCNECGNCDVFCPEDGGPYVLKPRFFGSLRSWKTFKTHDGFYLEKDGDAQTVWGRFDGKEFRMTVGLGRARYSGEGFEVEFAAEDPEGTIEGPATREVDLTFYWIMDWLRKSLLAEDAISYVNA